MIFVFGSNRAGVHGAGAARTARLKYGAILGKGEGPMGMSYALPTKGFQIEMISLDEIREHVKKFIAHADDTPNRNFKVTQVGCGLGGHRAEDIAPMFRGAPSNCYFDSAWKPYLRDTVKYWGTF